MNQSGQNALQNSFQDAEFSAGLSAEFSAESDQPITLKALLQDGDMQRLGDGYLFNPFNHRNTEITLADVQDLLNRYGVSAKVSNLELYKRAFVHSSYLKRPALENAAVQITVAPCPGNCLPLKTKSNERLEFIGDGVLELITKYYLYRRFPKADEGFMTEKKIALVKNEHIGKLASEMQLQRWLLLSNYAEEKNTRHNVKKLGCLFEAFLGALFLDFNKITVTDTERWFTDVFVTGPGFQMAQIFVENVLEKHVDWHKLVSTDDNFKNILQVLIQKEFKTTPDYLELPATEPGNYEMGVYLCLGQAIYQTTPNAAKPFVSFAIIHAAARVGPQLVLLGRAAHKIKKKAEQLACERAITALRYQ